MAKRTLELQPGEMLIGSEVVAMHRKILIGTKMDQGRLYISNQRIAFPDGVDSFSYPLDEIQCFRSNYLKGMIGRKRKINQRCQIETLPPLKWNGSAKSNI